jgi:hypothetical protein
MLSIEISKQHAGCVRRDEDEYVPERMEIREV